MQQLKGWLIALLVGAGLALLAAALIGGQVYHFWLQVWPWLAIAGAITLAGSLVRPCWQAYERMHRHALHTEAQRALIGVAQQASLALEAARIAGHHIDIQFTEAMTPTSFKITPVTPAQFVEAGPSRLALPAPVQQQLEPAIPQAPAFREMARQLTPERLILCYTANGPEYGTVDDLLSMAVTGKPGRGKTTALMYYVCILLACGAEVWIWDPHGAMAELRILNNQKLYQMPETARVTYLDRKQDIQASVAPILEELEARDELYRNGRQTKHPLLILADELPVLADYDADTEREYKALNKQRRAERLEEYPIPSLLTVIRRMVLEARKWRGFFVGSGQSFDADVLPTRVVENLSSRIVFFSSDRRARMAGLENDVIKQLLPALRRAGSGAMIMDCARWDGPQLGAIPYITPEDMLSFLGIVDGSIASTPQLPARVTGPLQKRILRPGAIEQEQDFYTRMEALRDTPGDLEIAGSVTVPNALENGLNEPLIDTQDTPEKRDYPQLTDLQVELFATAYQILGNIDKSLAQVKASSQYREHARVIIRERNLSKKEV